MGAIEDLPNRPLRPAEVKELKEHPKIESSVSIERPPMDDEGGTITMVMLVSGNAVGLNLDEDGWSKFVLERNISEADFATKAGLLAADLQGQYLPTS